jgi:predicted nucleic acid-binding Zn finger protein
MQARIDHIITSGSIKQMLFLPSGRKLWIVVGRYNEYWVDPQLGFCSCKDFYFTTLSGGEDCYHLKSVKKALQEKRSTPIEFRDTDYTQILQAIADDNISLLSSC